MFKKFKCNVAGARTNIGSRNTGERIMLQRERPASTSPRQALARGARITAIGSLVGAFEELSRLADVKPDSLFSWRLRRTSLPILQGQFGRWLNIYFEHPRYQYLVALRAAAAIGTIITPENTRCRALSMTTLTILLWAKSYRGWYGSDGSDQMSFIVLASGTAAELTPVTERNAALLSSFVAFQSLLSYFASGIAKATSALWRDGNAVKGVFRTQTYGDKDLYRFLVGKTWRAKALSRGVTGAEVLYPVIVILPRKLRYIALGVGAAFHIANARYMGLNRFLWAFSGSYPSIVSCAEMISSTWRRRRSRQGRE